MVMVTLKVSHRQDFHQMKRGLDGDGVMPFAKERISSRNCLRIKPIKKSFEDITRQKEIE